MKRISLHSKREIHPRLTLTEGTVERNLGRLNDIQDLNHPRKMVSLMSNNNTNQGRDQGDQAVDHQGEIYQRRKRVNRKVVEEEADLQRDKGGHRQDHEDTANLQNGEVDPQGIAVALREGEVNLQGDVVGLGHHAEDAIVINTRGVTLKDRHIKETQITSKLPCLFELFS